MRTSIYYKGLSMLIWLHGLMFVSPVSALNILIQWGCCYVAKAKAED
jgi:hypothetical protein